MKRFYIILALVCSGLGAMAQFGGGGNSIVGKISGIVVDSLTRQPLEYATVSITRSPGKVPLNGAVTDTKGSFKLNEIKTGKYKVIVSFIGYRTKTIDPVVTTLSKPDVNLGTIVVAPNGHALKTVNITSEAPVVENKIDKIVFNAEKDITSTGGNASDVLRKVPLVSVDINGNVSLRGDQNVKVLINGKPSGAMANNLADVLKSIPADQIKTVEVITSPSAKYDAEGSAGIINIVTKKKNMQGVSGSVSGGVGTRQNNGNANLNINQNRLSVTANFGGNYTWPQTSNTTSGSTVDSISAKYPAVVTAANSYTRVARYGYRGSGSLSYDVNNYNSFTSNIALNQGGFKTNGLSTVDRKTGLVGLAYRDSSTSNTTFGGFDWDNDYIHKFKKDGHQIDFAGQWSHGITDFNSVSLYSTTAYGDLRSVDNGSNNEYTLQADYTLPLNDKVKVEAGAKTIIRRLTSVYNNYDGVSNNVNTQADANSFTFDPGTSNIYDYNQNIYAGYTVWTFTLPKNYGLQLGARIESTTINGSPQSYISSTNATTYAQQYNANLGPISQSYNVFVPTMIFSKTIGNQTWKISYTKRIQRPSLTYLNPFLNQSNPTSWSVGNPVLSPEISHYAELNYSTFIGASVINLSAYYKHTSGLIEGIADTTSAPHGVTITRYQNIGTNDSWGSSFFGSINPIKILTIRGSINAYTYRPVPTEVPVADQTAHGTYISYNAFLSGSLNLKHDLAIESFMILNSPRRTIQGTNPSFGLWIIGVKKQFWDKKASLGLNTFDPFQKYKPFNSSITGPGFTQYSNTQFPFRSFGISFSYSFGKVTFSNPQDPTQQKKKGVNNDDLKQGDSNSPGGR